MVFIYVGILSIRDRLFNVLLRESSRLVGQSVHRGIPCPQYMSRKRLPVTSRRLLGYVANASQRRQNAVTLTAAP